MKIKEKNKKRIQGSISVLLVIILLPMMTFSGLVVDLCRANMAKQMMSSAGDLTMNTALANYDTILKDVYGLFAMSQLEGMDNEQLGIELNKYFAKTLSSYGVVPKDEADDYVAELIGDFRNILNNGYVDTTNFLELKNINLTATKVEGGSLANASVLRKQIVEYMKYRAPMGLGLSFLESLTAFKKMDAQNKVIEAQVKAQESTQDVTKACQTLIKMIRDYDKRVEEINKALSGVSNSKDPAIIPLEDYDSHVLKYLSSWGTENAPENYTHINKLTLVFLANTPSVDDKYLKSLGREDYIDPKGNLYSGYPGFSVNPKLAEDTASAKDQIDDQIKNLNDIYKKYVDNYTSSMLPSNLLTSNNTISKENEDAAINSFIKFEKFLLDLSDDGDVKYSQVKSVLEQIAILDKYRANYEDKIEDDIKSAEDDLTAAKKEKARLEATITAAKNLKTALDAAEEDVKDLEKDLEYARDDVDELEAALADAKDYVDELEADLKKATKEEEKAELQAALAAAKKERDRLEDDLDDAKDEVEDLEDDLADAEKKANEAEGKISEAKTEVNLAIQKVDGLNKQKKNTILSVTGCIQGFYSFGGAYQADLYYYNYYINAAKNTVGPEAQKIQAHFAQLLAYLDEVRTDLNEINEQIVNVKNAITTYNKNLDTWENSNASYERSNGGDTFSSQTSDDIEKARTEYDADLYNTLDTFVIAMWNEFDDLYTKLTESTNFVYGSKRIDQIANVADLIAAISGTSFSDVVTVEEATQKLSTLYKGETIEYVPYTMDYTNPKQLGFLAPQILQIQALKYLNSAYPDESKLTDEQKEANAIQESNYNTAKDKLTGKDNSGSGDTNSSSGTQDGTTTGFGYNYDSKSMGDTSLPSANKALKEKEADDEGYKLNEEDDKVNASSSVSSQTKKSNNVLSGIGDIVTHALENLYILNYLYENFSYNTILQEQMLKENPLTADTVVAQIGAAGLLFKDATKLEEAKKHITTLSNYKINEKNNYMYGAELEYILFGNDNAKTNVTSAKGSIYALRFAFNCVFAFTDSTIRNTTMSAGLAVQAATMGIVPYQVVQIVLQLALAAAESAVDLSALSNGLSVAVIKNKDTWSLSVSNVDNVLMDTANQAANAIAGKVTEIAYNSIRHVTNGLNDVLSAGTGELKNALGDLEENMTGAVRGVLESVVDDAFSSITAKIEEGINSLQYVNAGRATGEEKIDTLPTKEDVKAEATALFAQVRGEVDSAVSNACGGNTIALELAGDLTTQINNMITKIETDVMDVIDTAGDFDITEYMTKELSNIKIKMIEQANIAISNMTSVITGKASSAIDASSEKIQGYISQCGDELSDEAATLIKDEVQKMTDEFVNTTLKVNPSGETQHQPAKSSVVSMFRFSYKDYLMLLTYISICVNDESVLVRTADVIQKNVQHAATAGDYKHKAQTDKSKFLMSNAYTYISISATADLDMFFMNFDIFASQVEGAIQDETSTSEDTAGVTGAEDEKKDGTTIKYKGLLGY